MAIISNVGELKAALTEDLFHSRFVARYDRCIKNFETDANAQLRVLPMETSTLLTTVGGAVAVPTDYITWRTVKDATRPYWNELDYVHPAYLPSTSLNRSPPVFTIEGNQFITRPINDAANQWDFHYYQKIPSLAGGTSPALNSTTNWLLTEWPNAYLFGVMTELVAIGRNVEMAQLYKARRDEVFQEIVKRYAMTTGATSSAVRTAEYF